MDELPCYVGSFLNSIESDNEWEDSAESASASGSQGESFADVAVHTLPANKLLESCKSYDRQQLVEAPIFGAQDGLQSISVNSPMSAISPVMPKLSCSDNTTPNDRNLLTFIEEFGAQLDQHVENQSSIGSTSSDSATSQEIEIIELVTPPCDLRGQELRAKRRRVPTVSAEIIDLTNSPVFIQL